jgi:hypothetical protein
VRVSGLPLYPVTSCNISNRWAVSTPRYCKSVGRAITSCHVPQQFKPLVCVATVVTERVSGVTSRPVTSLDSTNRYAVSTRWLM